MHDHVHDEQDAHFEPTQAFGDVKSVHLIGAGGIGISAIGKYFLERGVKVSGSDAKQSAITDDLGKRGAQIAIGHQGSNIPEDCDLVVYTEAAGEDNVERMVAKELGIRQLGHFDFLGELSKTCRTVCVTGTNGKSTTTAMVGAIFVACGWDPTVFVGSLMPGWPLGNLRLGKGDLLVVEGDEYKQKMVKLFPETTVITNIEEDHLDVYRDLDHIVATFQELAEKTTHDVIVNADDVNSERITARNRTTYGANIADVWAEDRVAEAGEQSFLVKRNVVGHDETLGRISLRVPGAFNMMNALAATTVALSYGAPFAKVQEALAAFTGVWRRFERVGAFQGADVISDYGHHPTAIKVTLTAAKEFFPGRRVVLLFEPHQHSRTKELFADFVQAFGDADELVLSEVYGVKGREDAAGAVSSADLVRVIGRGVYAKDLAEAEHMLRDMVHEGDVVIVMGAGDVDVVARNLAE